MLFRISVDVVPCKTCGSDASLCLQTTPKNSTLQCDSCGQNISGEDQFLLIQRWNAVNSAEKEELRTEYEELRTESFLLQPSTSPSSYPFLDPAFLFAMNDIGRLGFERYGEASFHAQRLRGSRERDHRLSTSTIQQHANNHFTEYALQIKHEHFNTAIHQLAAVAFNAMMEAYFAS